jgi:hypothetical protein
MILVEVSRSLLSSMVLGENDGGIAVMFGCRRGTRKRTGGRRSRRTNGRRSRGTMIRAVKRRTVVMERDVLRHFKVVGFLVLI